VPVFPAGARGQLCDTRLVSTVAVGCELAGYRIEALIGRGGMGIVYRGSDLRLGRPVAIKLISAERATDPVVRQRFEREARMMAALEHPNVLPIYAAGEENGSLFLVMRYVDGTDLGAVLRAQGRLEPVRAVRIVDQVARALDAAHETGLVHRDVKPANVLLEGEHVYLSDFGLGRAIEGATKLTDSSEWLGTVDFCSPEQLRGKPTDARSDIYALGCVLHTALTGVPPLHRDTAEATMLAHLSDEPPPPSRSGVATSFDPVIRRALAKRPEERHASAGELGRAARVAAGGVRGARALPRVPEAAAPPTGAGPTVPDDEPTATVLDLRPPPPLRGAPLVSSRPRRARAAGVAALAILLTGLAVAAALILTSGRTHPPGPLTTGEINRAVHAFATAYSNRDGRALTAVLAPDVVRAGTSGKIVRGRQAVLAQYEAQFGSISGYGIGDVRVQPGWAGRAVAHFTLLRGGQPAGSGIVTFGIERVRGRPEIGLIATSP
jgi:serine/threonine-protein kinase